MLMKSKQNRKRGNTRYILSLAIVKRNFTITIIFRNVEFERHLKTAISFFLRKMKNRIRHPQIVIHSLLRLALIVRLTVETTATHQDSTTAVQLVNGKYDELDLNSRLSAIEAKSKHQEDEISLLKTLRVEDKKKVNQLRERVEQLEASVVKTTENERILERHQKRPFRLAPVDIIR